MGLALVTPQKKSQTEDWVQLCSASAIIHSTSDYKSHDWDALRKQIGPEIDHTIRLAQSNRWCTSIDAKRGYVAAARDRMKQVAKKNGYILWFPNNTVFDPWHEVKAKTQSKTK